MVAFHPRLTQPTRHERPADPLRRTRLPPALRAESLILPVTDGCSWNACTFCEMYQAPQKAFRARSEDEVLDSIRRTGERYGSQIRRVFLADGDALVLPTRRLLTILEAIRQHLPAVHRVSSYCLARNLKKKSVAELTELRAAGLSMAYLGAESGDDEVLARVSKGETFDTTRDALDKLGAAGITRSVMILNGLGGQQLSDQHADNSARLANATQPEYLSTLVVSFPTARRASAPASRAGSPWPARAVRRDGALLVAAGAEPQRVQIGPRQQHPGAQGHPRRRQGAAAGTGAPGHRHARGGAAAAGVGAGL
jgi:radical SAM superfamily enzyme YgiQ (UPF0313 family)